MQSSEPALKIFDTKTWAQRETMPGLPPGAVDYYPAPGSGRAIYLSRNDVVALWDANQQREVAKVDDNARIRLVAFSPDESLVAVATVHKGRGDYWSNCRIRIWRMDNGNLVRELRPSEQSTCESVEALFWSPGGEYVLGAIKANILFTQIGIDVWSVESGRHRGELTGCPTDVTGTGLLADGCRLVAGCYDGIIRIWDLASALKRIEEVEQSLVKERQAE